MNILYIILSVEIIFFGATGFNRLSTVLILLLGIALLAKIYSKGQPEPNIWVDVRHKLTAVLIENKIIPESPSSNSETQYEPYYRVDSTEIAITINPNTVDDLRNIGIDGVLICLYLLKHRGSFSSVKIIQNDLNIPKSTIYRNIQKLVDMHYVETQGTLDEPGKTYYRIAYNGESLMFDFYDLLHIPGTYNTQTVK